MKRLLPYFFLLACFIGTPKDSYSQSWQNYPSGATQVVLDGIWFGIADYCMISYCPTLYKVTGFNNNLYSTQYSEVFLFTNEELGLSIFGRNVSLLTDTGNSWTNIGSLLPTAAGSGLDVISLLAVHDSLGYVLSENSQTSTHYVTRIEKDTSIIVHSWDSVFTTKTYEDFNLFRFMNFTNDSTGFVILTDTFRNKSYVMKTEDYGIQWNVVLEDSMTVFRSILFRDSLNAVVTATNKLYKTADAGLTWTTIPVPSTPIGLLKSANFYNDSIGYLVSDGGYVMRTDNGGSNWQIELDSSNSPYPYPIIFDLGKIIDDEIAYVHCGSRYLSILRRSTTVSSKLRESLAAADFTIYPNPAKTQIQLKLAEDLIIEEIVIHDLKGQLIKSANTKTIDVSDLGSGVYILSLNLNDGVVRKKFVVE